MSWRISASVGRWERGARNNRRDVETTQTLLAEVALLQDDAQVDPGAIDGSIAQRSDDSSTVRAIERFQSVSGLVVDGMIEANRRTWNELVRVVDSDDVASNPNIPGQTCFPFNTLPAVDWMTGMRAFGANRSNGARAHAGCDLYFPQGTWIHAVADGQVVRGPYWFYAETYAFEIDHGDRLIRYCEVQPGPPIRAGDRVAAGQRIARVGRLVGVSVPSDMLHVEVYDKTATGALTVRDAHASAKRADGVAFGRRRDLVDPTELLTQWSAQLPA
jgi:peptidoglycan hydrolase-like protein with peptidoglycan-binding domain